MHTIHYLASLLFASLTFTLLTGCEGPEIIERDTIRIVEVPADAGAGDAAMSWDSSDIPNTGEDAKAQPPVRVKKDGRSKTDVLTTTDPVKKASLSFDFGSSEYYTVQFGVLPPTGGPLATRGVYDAIAEILWTVEGGGIIRRLVSVGNGVSVSGTAESVKVTVQDITDPALGTGANPYTVTISVSSGTRPSEDRPVTLSGPLFQVPPAGILTVAVPENAGVISVETSVSYAAGAPIVPGRAFVSQKAGGTDLKDYDAEVEVGFVALAANANFIQFVNGDAGNACTVTFTWGIDG